MTEEITRLTNQGRRKDEEIASLKELVKEMFNHLDDGHNYGFEKELL